MDSDNNNEIDERMENENEPSTSEQQNNENIRAGSMETAEETERLQRIQPAAVEPMEVSRSESQLSGLVSGIRNLENIDSNENLRYRQQEPSCSSSDTTTRSGTSDEGTSDSPFERKSLEGGSKSQPSGSKSGKYFKLPHSKSSLGSTGAESPRKKARVRKMDVTVEKESCKGVGVRQVIPDLMDLSLAKSSSSSETEDSTKTQSRVSGEQPQAESNYDSSSSAENDSSKLNVLGKKSSDVDISSDEAAKCVDTKPASKSQTISSSQGASCDSNQNVEEMTASGSVASNKPKHPATPERKKYRKRKMPVHCVRSDSGEEADRSDESCVTELKTQKKLKRKRVNSAEVEKDESENSEPLEPSPKRLRRKPPSAESPKEKPKTKSPSKSSSGEMDCN